MHSCLSTHGWQTTAYLSDACWLISIVSVVSHGSLSLQIYTDTVHSVVKCCSVLKINYKVEQKVPTYYTFIQHSSWKKCHRKFHRKYPDWSVSCKAMICNIMPHIFSIGSVLDERKYQKRRILTERKKLDDIGTWSEVIPEKFCFLALQCGVAKSTAHIGTKLQKLQLCVLQLYIAYCFQSAKQEFDTVNGFWNRYPVFSGLHDVELFV